MMKDNRTTLRRYQEADFNLRLNLYLQYPALRTQFMEIDRGELNHGAQRRWGRLEHPLATRLTVLMSTSIGCVRRLLAPAKS